MLEGLCVSLPCPFLFVECCKSLLIKQFTRCFGKNLETFHQLNDLLLQLKKLVFINFLVMFVENRYSSWPLTGFLEAGVSSEISQCGCSYFSVYLLCFAGLGFAVVVRLFV